MLVLRYLAKVLKLVECPSSFVSEEEASHMTLNFLGHLVAFRLPNPVSLGPGYPWPMLYSTDPAPHKPLDLNHSCFAISKLF